MSQGSTGPTVQASRDVFVGDLLGCGVLDWARLDWAEVCWRGLCWHVSGWKGWDGLG